LRLVKTLRQGRASKTFRAQLAFAALAASAACLAGCAHTGTPSGASRLADVQTWWIMIGHNPNPLSTNWAKVTEGLDMAVIDFDANIPFREWNPRTLRLAYLSVGEANPSRRYWAAVRHQPYLVEPNPHWGGSSFRVDIRSAAWQELLIYNEAQNEVVFVKYLD
jgi:hypothetical protein